MCAMRARPAWTAVLCLAASASAGEDARPGDSSVATSNGAVVHGVDAKLLAARLRDVDRKALAGDAKGAAADLADILSGDLTPLVDEGADAYLCVVEAALRRVAALAPEGLAAYRAIVDPRAASILADAVARTDAALLARHARAMALSTHGPRMLVALSDLRAARGEAALAAQSLADALRLWPAAGATAEMPGVARAEVVLRLATLFAAVGDVDSVRWLARETPASALDGPSPATAGAKLADDLARCAATAAARDPAHAEGPAGPLHVAAEKVLDGSPVRESETFVPRDIPVRALPIGTPERPVLLACEAPGVQLNARVVALAVAPEPKGALTTIWAWPSKEEFQAVMRRGLHGPFEPARCGDLVVFAWPAPPDARQNGERMPAAPEDEHRTLIALSVSAEGRLVDERGGDDEATRDDRDRALVATLDESGDVQREPLSFSGRPLVVGQSVFTTLVRRVENGPQTELHVARFDVVAQGAGARLRERWRRHVLDGIAMPPVRLPTDDSTREVYDPLAAPSSMAHRWGRVYVASNSGAVACLDATDGTVEWVQAYARFGPPKRWQSVPTRQRTWKDVPVAVDGQHVWVAPTDGDDLLQFLAMPRATRSTLVQSWRFHGGAGTSTEDGPLLPNMRPDEIVDVSQGVCRLSGAKADTRAGALVRIGGPLASFRARAAAADEPRRSYAYAQIPEDVAAGSPCVVRDAVIFPSWKAVYRVSLGDLEAAPTVLWRPESARVPPPDQIGDLVPDGRRLWSVTPRRVVLFEGTPADRK
jgi:hypothetical protein